jgi:hypothetical protein
MATEEVTSQWRLASTTPTILRLMASSWKRARGAVTVLLMLLMTGACGATVTPSDYWVYESGSDGGFGEDSSGAFDSGFFGQDSAGRDGSSTSDTGVNADTGACIPVSPNPAPPLHGGPGCPSEATCSPRDESLLSPTWVPPLPRMQNACTQAQIATFYQDCLALVGDETTFPCETWQSQNPTCAQCLVSPNPNVSGAVLLYGNVALVNVAGCIYTAEPCQKSCAQAMQDLVQCDDAACNPSATGNCDVIGLQSEATYAQCVTEANGSCGCSQYYDAALSCENQLLSSSHPSFEICYGGIRQPTLQQQYTLVATYMCGP